MSQKISLALLIACAIGAGSSADAQTPSQNSPQNDTGTSDSGQYCEPIPLDHFNGDNELTPTIVQTWVRACMDERSDELTGSDKLTRNLSRTSAFGGIGALASGLTQQAAGTTNAWVAIGLAPVLADDVQQRQRVSAIRHGFLARLDQLQCRARFLDHSTTNINGAREQIDAKAGSLEDLVAQELESLPERVIEGTAVAPYDAIIREALRLVQEARDLQAYAGLLAEDDEIARLEAIAYNYLAEEYQLMRRQTLARPEVTFRSILASPLRMAARVVEGEPNATYTHQSVATPQQSTFSARYSVGMDLDERDIRQMNLRVRAPHYLLVPAAKRGAARALLLKMGELSEQSILLRREIVLFIDAATNDDPAACPTFRLSERTVTTTTTTTESAVTPPPPPPPPPSPERPRNDDSSRSEGDNPQPPER